MLVVIIHQFAWGMSQAIPFAIGVVVHGIVEAQEVTTTTKELMKRPCLV